MGVCARCSTTGGPDFGFCDLSFIFAMAEFWFYVVSLATMSSCMAIFTGGETDVGSPLRVAQCRATCLERVSQIFDQYLQKPSPHQ